MGLNDLNFTTVNFFLVQTTYMGWASINIPFSIQKKFYLLKLQLIKIFNLNTIKDIFNQIDILSYIKYLI